MLTDKLHSLEISLTIGCKLDCLYCPQKVLLARYYEKDKNRCNKLKFEDFKMALEKVERGGTISFCGMSEPFQNEKCADMICHAYALGYKISLLTTLVGMKRGDYEKIKDIEFDSFILHIPDEERHSKFIINDEYLELLKLVQQNIKIDYYSCHGRVHHDVEKIIDHNKYAGLGLCNRAGNLEGIGHSTYIEKDKIICYHGSEMKLGGWTPVMLPDGTLVLCCQDYGMKHVLGNLIYESWESIQKSDEYLFYKHGLENGGCDILCRTCADAKKVAELPSMHIKELVLRKQELKKELEKSIVNTSDVITKLAIADTVCVFGLGKLFRDHYFQEYWHEGLNTKILSDNNSNLHGKEFEGLLCIPPEKIKEYPNVAVVMFVNSTLEIERQLKSLGINNIIDIKELIKVEKEHF